MGLRSGRTRSVFLAVAAAILGPAYPAHAATVTATLNEPNLSFDLTYSAAPGETNRLFIIQGLNFHVIDRGANITAGAGCSSVSSEEVTCPITADELGVGGAGVLRVTVTLGDMNDFLFVTGSGEPDTNTFGEGGADYIEVGAEGGHMLDGGAGADTLRGGAGHSVLVGGPGADVLNGEPATNSFSLTTADYSAHTNPVTADVDGVADDGEAGEGDNSSRSTRLWAAWPPIR
jgi:Ca2+-binding RTX toxin-like protein